MSVEVPAPNLQRQSAQLTATTDIGVWPLKDAAWDDVPAFVVAAPTTIILWVADVFTCDSDEPADALHSDWDALTAGVMPIIEAAGGDITAEPMYYPELDDGHAYGWRRFNRSGLLPDGAMTLTVTVTHTRDSGLVTVEYLSPNGSGFNNMAYTVPEEFREDEWQRWVAVHLT